MALTAAACAVPGVFLLLRRLALVSDAISHVLLLGIVTAFLITRDLHSPWLVIGATLSGVLTVVLVEALRRTDRVREDAAIGLVFPALFAAGVLLVSVYSRNVHLDTDAVLLGIPEFAAARPFRWLGISWGSHARFSMGVMLLVNLTFVILLFKELKLSTFDAALATTLGFTPAVLHYGLMTLTSLTAVLAFDAVGSILVVAFMVVPAAMAYLLTDHLVRLIVLACGLAALGGVLGTLLALALDATVAGSVASTLGLMFGIVLLAAPEHGWIAARRRQRRLQREFRVTMLLIHLLHHEDTAREADESRCQTLHEHLRWPAPRVGVVIEEAVQAGFVVETKGHLKLTHLGRVRAQAALHLGQE